MKPTPKRTPVTNLRALFERRLNASCIPPSKTNGTRKIKHNKTDILQLQINSKSAIRYPKSTPVHRAHNGN